MSEPRLWAEDAEYVRRFGRRAFRSADGCGVAASGPGWLGCGPDRNLLTRAGGVAIYPNETAAIAAVDAAFLTAAAEADR